MKILPTLSIELLDFPFHPVGLHYHGISHSNAEYLMHAAISSGKISKEEYDGGSFFNIKIREKLVSNLSPTEVEQIANNIGVSLPFLERKVKSLATLYGGNPENIEKATLKRLISYFKEPTSWLYRSSRWEQYEKEWNLTGISIIHVGPLSLPFPELAKELTDEQAKLFKIYAKVISRKEEPNYDYHFRINKLKKKKTNVDGERVVLFGFLVGRVSKLDDGTNRFRATLCDSPYFPNPKHKITIILDGSEHATFDEDLRKLAGYELMILGKINGRNIRVSACLKVRVLPKIKPPKRKEQLSLGLFQ
jgi:hypothetical protein